MIVFSGKLLAPKKSATNEDAENILSGKHAQKVALKNLSKQEKLLLVELQKTRIEIVRELEKLDPTVCNTTENWFEVKQTIGHYENKLLGDGLAVTTSLKNKIDEGPPASSRNSLLQGGTYAPISPLRPSSKGSPFSFSGALNNSNNVSRVDLSKVPAKYSAFKTGIDILPVMATTGDAAFEVGLRRQGRSDAHSPKYKLNIT
jgi:hypothetical protein